MRWIVGIVALLGLALVLQAGLVAFAGYVLLGVFLLSRFLAREWIANLHAERETDHSPREVGESIEVVMRIRNAGRWPIAWVLVEDMLPESALRVRPPKLTAKGSRLRVLFLPAGKAKPVKYRITFDSRGYFPIGPCVAETGDVFGLHRRHRLLSAPVYVMVYPKVLPLGGYDFASERPIGEVRLANRLFEDPTRTAGVRPYQLGDPLQRVHWRATARTGMLHSRVYEPTSLAGATILVDFHLDGYPKRGEPYRSDLAITAACSIANAVVLLNQQVGFASNGRDAAERIRQEALESEEPGAEHATRAATRERFELREKSDRLRPVTVETRRGIDQFQQIREALARLELTDGMTFSSLILEVGPRLPRDATVLCLLPRVPVDSAVALGQLRRQGFAITALLVGLTDEEERAVAAGRLAAEGIRDVRFLGSEQELATLGERGRAAPPEYQISATLA